MPVVQPQPDPGLPRTCIIGAGSSGIAAAKIFAENAIPFDCFEASDRIGGNWVFKNTNGMSSAYRSLHINTSRDKMAYSDFPMPASYPQFPHHTQIAAYFDAYADHFGIRERITFNTSVAGCERTADGLWAVTLDHGETRLYDALVVANGHHWSPRWPEPAYPGRFDGQQMHSHDYIDPTEPVNCRGKRVLVVGFGNSALDIACELGRKGEAEKLMLSTRRGYWVIPKFFGAEVLDAQSPHPSEDPPLWMRMMPAPLGRWLAQRRVEAVFGRPEAHGLQKPDHPFLATHPAVSQELYIRIGSGDVMPKPGIAALEGGAVRFTDGTTEPVDVIIWCTGYRITFPFFDERLIWAKDNDIALWQRMIDPRFDDLFFIGLVQPLCAMMPIAEEQARFTAAYLTGRYIAPEAALMEEERLAMHHRIKSSYVASARHTVQINCAEYTYGLRQELKRGEARAAALRARRLPVPALAAGLGTRAAA